MQAIAQGLWDCLMSALFARIYVVLLLALLVLGTLAYGLLDGTNRVRFHQHAEEQTAWVNELIVQGWERQPAERSADWLNLVSSLTMLPWEVTSPADSGNQPLDTGWHRQAAQLELPLADNRVLQSGELTDWTQWRVGAGYLLLNELSRVPAGQRSERLAELAPDIPFPVALVSLQEAPELGVLARRQLGQGQAWVRTREGGLGQVTEWIYVPVGEGFVLRLGPLERFSWLTPQGLLGLGGLFLAGLVLVAWVVLSPLRRRLHRITQAVDAMGHHSGEEVRVPEAPADELGRMAAHVNQMADRLALTAQRNRELNQAVSHDLKTPLARLRFALALLPEDAQRTAAGQDIRQATDDLEHLTGELLEFHRLDNQGSAAPAWYPVDLSAVLERAMEQVQPAQATTLPPQQPGLQLPLETGALQRLVQNLLTNAASYGRERIGVEVGQDTDQWWLSIEDDGPGIPEAERERVMEPFVRLDTARSLNRRGHGLGLAICRALVKTAGGRLKLEDSSWGGLRVTLSLPCLPDTTRP